MRQPYAIAETATPPSTRADLRQVNLDDDVMRVPLTGLAMILGAQPSVAAVYDRAITVFSPDGKLMQVAYADEAVKRGSLAVAASNGRDSIAMCLERPATISFDTSPSASATTSTSTTRKSEQQPDDDACVGEHGGKGRRRKRRHHGDGGVRDPGVGVGIVDRANSQDLKLCEIDEGVYLAFAGISADGRVLASKIRLECQSYHYSMGAAPSVGYIARYIGGLQHRYTRTGGARPYGVACLVAGFDEDTLLPSVFRSEPSGAFAEWTASAVGKGSEKALAKLESVPDFCALDWLGTTEASVRAALAGGAKECDVLVLRRKVEGADPPATEARTGTEEGVESRATAGAGGAWDGAGWRDRGGAWSKSFLGSVGADGAVVLEEVEGQLAAAAAAAAAAATADTNGTGKPRRNIMTSYGETRLQQSPRANLVDDLTTVSGLILAYGVVVTIGGITDLAGASAAIDVAPDIGGSEGVFPPIVLLLAQLTVSTFGLVSIFLGFQYVACRWGSKGSALVGLLVTLAAWFPFLVTVSLVAFNAHHKNIDGGPLTIPGTPSQTDINSVAAIGVLGFWGYAGTVIGALTFLQWKMYRFFEGGASTYSASYYRSRLGYYGFLTLMVGALQIALGAHIQDMFGWGELEAPVVAVVFFVKFPEISIAVGCVQILYGLYILYRSTTPGVGPSTGNKDPGLFTFQLVAWSVFLISTGAQVLGQTSLVGSGPALFIRNVIGFALFPIYLDVLAHTTPENVTADMFSMTKTTNSGV
eukprot:g12145.t1